MFLDRCFDDNKKDIDINMSNKCCPIYECPKENIVNRDIIYDVPHIIPINTRIINHHIYRHSYIPMYTCCEENVCSEVYDNNCKW